MDIPIKLTSDMNLDCIWKWEIVFTASKPSWIRGRNWEDLAYCNRCCIYLVVISLHMLRIYIAYWKWGVKCVICSYISFRLFVLHFTKTLLFIVQFFVKGWFIMFGSFHHTVNMSRSHRCNIDQLLFSASNRSLLKALSQCVSNLVMQLYKGRDAWTRYAAHSLGMIKFSSTKTRFFCIQGLELATYVAEPKM